MISELLEILDFYESKYIFTRAYIDSIFRYQGKHFIDFLKTQPRYSTIRSCDISWKLAEDIFTIMSRESSKKTKYGNRICGLPSDCIGLKDYLCGVFEVDGKN